jgi:hypothetical protein
MVHRISRAIALMLCACGATDEPRTTPEPELEAVAEPPPVVTEVDPPIALAEPAAILGGRFLARLPATVDASATRISEGPTTELESIAVYPFGTAERPLSIVVRDVPRLATSDLVVGTAALLAPRPNRDGRLGPVFEVSEIEVPPPMRAALAVPDDLVPLDLPADVVGYGGDAATAASSLSAAVYVAEGDGAVQVIELACDPSSCPRPELESLARAIGASVRPGTSPLSRAAATRRITAFDLDLPADFSVRKFEGEDYTSYSIRPLSPLVSEDGASLGVFQAVSSPPPEEPLAPAPTERGRLLGRSVRWRVEQNHGRITWAHECEIEGAIYYWTLSGADAASLAPLAAVVGSARVATDMDFEPGTRCAPFEPCPAHRYTSISARDPSGSVSLRATASAGANVTSTVTNGTVVTIGERRGAFVHVLTPSDGWASASSLVGFCE